MSAMDYDFAVCEATKQGIEWYVVQCRVLCISTGSLYTLHYGLHRNYESKVQLVLSGADAVLHDFEALDMADSMARNITKRALVAAQHFYDHVRLARKWLVAASVGSFVDSLDEREAASAAAQFIMEASNG